MRRFAAILAICIATLSATAARALADSTLDVIKSRGKLIAGVVPDYPPFGQVDQSGEIVGFDADVAAYIAKKLGVQLQLQPVSTSERIPMLVNGNIDIDVAAFTITQKRTEAIDFSIPYMVMGSGVLIPAGSTAASMQDLSAKRVSFTQGTPYADSTKKDLPSAEIIQFQDTAQG
jgi:polar amino acid transport system substrate-binding protein